MTARRVVCKVKNCDRGGILVAGLCEPHYVRRHRGVRHRHPIVSRHRVPAVWLLPRVRG
jgi:hypothetical protein